MFWKGLEEKLKNPETLQQRYGLGKPKQPNLLPNAREGEDKFDGILDELAAAAQAEDADSEVAGGFEWVD